MLSAGIERDVVHAVGKTSLLTRQYSGDQLRGRRVGEIDNVDTAAGITGEIPDAVRSLPALHAVGSAGRRISDGQHRSVWIGNIDDLHSSIVSPACYVVVHLAYAVYRPGLAVHFGVAIRSRGGIAVRTKSHVKPWLNR